MGRSRSYHKIRGGRDSHFCSREQSYKRKDRKKQKQPRLCVYTLLVEATFQPKRAGDRESFSTFQSTGGNITMSDQTRQQQERVKKERKERWF